MVGIGIWMVMATAVTLALPSGCHCLLSDRTWYVQYKPAGVFVAKTPTRVPLAVSWHCPPGVPRGTPRKHLMKGLMTVTVLVIYIGAMVGNL